MMLNPIRSCGFLKLLKNLLFFTEFGLQLKFTLFAVFLYKSYVWEKFGSGVMGQNSLGQTDCMIFKSLEQGDEIA